jgi:hypothetical protein
MRGKRKAEAPRRSKASKPTRAKAAKALVWKGSGRYCEAEAGRGKYYVTRPLIRPLFRGDPKFGDFSVYFLPRGGVASEDRRELGTARTFEAAKALAQRDYERSAS